MTLEQCWHRVPGGTTRAALDLVDALHALPVSDGPDLELVGVAAWHRNPPPAPWRPSISVAHLRLPRRVLYESWHRLRWPAVERATGPVEVIHATALAMPPRTVPIVATLHDLAFRRFPEQFTRNGLVFFEGAVAAMRRDADVVMCSSAATADDALHAGFDADRLRIVPLGVTPPVLDPRDAAARRARLGVSGRYVLHVGTAEPRKNRKALVQAARSLPGDVTVVLVGPPGWGDEALPVDRDRVVELGFVDDADKWALMAGAAVFCFPSLWEGFGLPVLEAMAAGAPVVTSRETTMAEITGDAALLVDPTDVSALADALGAVLDDTDGRVDQMIADGRTRAADFDLGATAAQTAALYREVVAR